MHHDAASAIAMSASIQKTISIGQSSRAYRADLGSRDAGFTVAKCKREKEMWYWQIFTAHAPSAQTRKLKPTGYHLLPRTWAYEYRESLISTDPYFSNAMDALKKLDEIEQIP